MSSRPLSFAELAALDEVVCRRDHALPDARRWTAYRLSVLAEDGYPQLANLVRENPAIARLEVAGISDRGLRTLLPALDAAERLGSLRLPRPARLGDDAVSGVLQLFHRRQRGAAAPRAPSEPPPAHILNIEALDLRGGSLLGTTMQSIALDTLLRLDLSGQENLTDGVVEHIVLHCRLLRVLSLAGTPVTERLLAFLNKHGERVVELDVTNCPELRVLNLDHVQRLGADLVGVQRVVAPALTHFARSLTTFAVVEFRCPQLSRLSFDGVVLREREFRIIGDGAGAALRELVLLRCRVSGFGALASRLRRLLRVALRDCQGITDADVTSLPGCLESADLAGCYYLTDEGIHRFCTRCTGLRSLSLQRVSNLTDRGLDLVAQRCPHLVTVDLLGCRKVSVLAVDRIVSHCAAIETVLHDEYRTVKLHARSDDPLGDDLRIASRDGGDAGAADVVLDWLRRSATPGSLQLGSEAPHSPLLSSASPLRRGPTAASPAAAGRAPCPPPQRPPHAGTEKLTCRRTISTSQPAHLVTPQAPPVAAPHEAGPEPGWDKERSVTDSSL